MDTLGTDVRKGLRNDDAIGPTPPAGVDDGIPVLPDAVEVVLELEDGETTLFEAAITAFHANEFLRAESLFLEEAERTIEDAPQRAAIAFRQAALAAREAGNLDGSDHWMRLAGREYLRVSEDPRTPLPFIREAAVMAAKCFLSVENLHVATKGLRRAQAIDSVLRADDDMMAGATGIPFRHEQAADAPDADTGSDAEGDSSADGRIRELFTPTPVIGLQLVESGAPEVTEGGRDHSAGWLERLRNLLPSHKVA